MGSSVYNAALLEVKIQLGTAHYVTVTLAAIGHLYHHRRVGSLSNWVLLHKQIFCELILLYRVVIWWISSVISYCYNNAHVGTSPSRYNLYDRQQMILDTWNNVPVEASHPKWTTSLLSGSNDHPHTGMACNCRKWIRGLGNNYMNVGCHMTGWKVTDRNMATTVPNRAKLNNLSLLSVVSYMVLMMDEWVEALV